MKKDMKVPSPKKGHKSKVKSMARKAFGGLY